MIPLFLENKPHIVPGIPGGLPVAVVKFVPIGGQVKTAALHIQRTTVIVDNPDLGVKLHLQVGQGIVKLFDQIVAVVIRGIMANLQGIVLDTKAGPVRRMDRPAAEITAGKFLRKDRFHLSKGVIIHPGYQIAPLIRNRPGRTEVVFMEEFHRVARTIFNRFGYHLAIGVNIIFIAIVILRVFHDRVNPAVINIINRLSAVGGLIADTIPIVTVGLQQPQDQRHIAMGLLVLH